MKEFDELVLLDGVSNGRALLRRKECIEFYHLETNTVLDTFSHVDLAATVGATFSPEWYHIDQVCAKFDWNPARKQFAIFSNTLSFYVLMEYSTDKGLDKLSVLNYGSTFIYDLSDPLSLGAAILLNGVLFASPISAVRVDSAIHRGCEASTVVACDLKSFKSPGNICHTVTNWAIWLPNF